MQAASGEAAFDACFDRVRLFRLGEDQVVAEAIGQAGADAPGAEGVAVGSEDIHRRHQLVTDRQSARDRLVRGIAQVGRNDVRCRVGRR